MPRIGNGTVQLLTGANVLEDLRVEVTSSGSTGCPDVIRLPLGWSLFGLTFGLTSSKNVSCNFLSAQSEEMQTLHATYLRDKIDFSPVTADEEIESLDIIKCLSAKDRRTYELMKDSVTKFYLVRVSQRDQDCLRFLWWPEGGMSKQPFRMCVDLFWATSSSSCAAFSLRQAALEFGSNFDPQVTTTGEKISTSTTFCVQPRQHDGIRLIKGL